MPLALLTIVSTRVSPKVGSFFTCRASLFSRGMRPFTYIRMSLSSARMSRLAIPSKSPLIVARGHAVTNSLAVSGKDRSALSRFALLPSSSGHSSRVSTMTNTFENLLISSFNGLKRLMIVSSVCLSM